MIRMTSNQFRDWEHKTITLLGMSGVGKTTLANKLPYSSWFHYSGDYRIGTRYLSEPIIDDIKRRVMQVPYLSDLLRTDSIYICSNITINNLAPLSRFIGKIGNPEQGGLDRQEFLRRQQLHREAEICAMRDVVEFTRKAREIYGYAHFINDAGGSICDLNDAQTIQLLAEHTIILYMEADDALERQMVARQAKSPKPLYYDEGFLGEHLAHYLHENDLNSERCVDPENFVRWIFPRLIAYRRPLYKAIANRYGYTVSMRHAEHVTDEQSFEDLICTALDQQPTAIA